MSKNETFEKKKKFRMPSKIKSYKIEKELYEISKGHICVGTNLNINEKVLIKIYEKEIIQYNPEELSLINNEIFMMKLINHKNALKLYEIIESPSYIYLIMEYFNGVKLSDYITKRGKLSEDDALNLYKQVLSFLLYIHDMSMGHLNINSFNILIDNFNNIKICEFKYSIFYSNDDRTKCDYLGETSFLSPELCSKKSCYPDLSDIWSSGVILYLMTVGELPFHSQSDLDLQKLIMKAEYKLPSNMDSNLQDFIKNIFEEKEEDRCTFEDIFNSSLFKQKKITKNTLPIGFNILSVKYPIDDVVLDICETNFNLEPDDIRRQLKDNIFDPKTSLYKQILNKLTNKKIPTEGDLISNKFNDYINNEKNYLDGKTQKKNIQKNLNKEIEFKKINKEKEKDINVDQTHALVKLDELLKTYKEKNKPEEEELDKNKEKKKEKKVEIEDNKENKENKEINNTQKIVNKKSTFKNKQKKPKGATEKKVNIINLNKGRRMSSNVNMDAKLKASLNRFKHFQMNQQKKQKTKNKKQPNYTEKKNDIIEEKDELDDKKSKNKGESKKDGDNENSLSKSSSSSGIIKRSITVRVKRANTKYIKSKNALTLKDDNPFIDKKSQKKVVQFKDKGNANINKNEKKIDNKSLSKKSSKSVIKDTKNTKKDDKPVSKEEFFNQIKGVKLKKVVPNQYNKSDEKKKKGPSGNAVESVSVSVNNVRDLIEERLRHTHIMDVKTGKEIKLKEYKRPNNSVQNKKIDNKDIGKVKNKHENDLKAIRKQLEEKYITTDPINNKKKKNNRKSVNYDNMFTFKSKAIALNNEDIKRVNSKDTNDRNSNDAIKRVRSRDARKFKYNVNKNDVIFEEDKNEIVTPKFKKNEKKKKEKKEEEERQRKEEEEKKGIQEEEKKKDEEDEIDINEQEEKLKREKEEEKRIKEIEKKIKDKKLKQKKEEEKERKLEIERWAKIYEEERRKEEEERKRKKNEEDKEKRKKDDLENRKKRKEENEKKRKEKEEEDVQREKEEKVRKQKEKERIKKEEEEKIKKWKEDKMKKKEMEEKNRILEEEKRRKEEEEEKRIKREEKKEENKRKRLEEQEENRKMLEEYENRQKQEEENRRKRENLRKEKEEEMRLKREKQDKERRNKIKSDRIAEGKKELNMKKKKLESDSESSEKPNKKKAKKLKTEKNNNNNNYHNPFDFFKSNDSDEESSPEPREKPEEKKNIKKDEGKKKLNKSVENRKNDINDMLNQYTNYFFDENTLNQLKNSNKVKENKTNVEKTNAKRGLYHYQNYPKKEEKRYVSKKFETRNRNPGGLGLKQANTVRDNINNKKQDKKDSINNKKIRKKSNLNDENTDNDALSERIQKGRNKNDKRLNNTVAYNNEGNLTKENDSNRSKKKLNTKNAIMKKNNSKIKIKKINNTKSNELVQNLIDDFDQTMEEYSNIYGNSTARGNKNNSSEKRLNNKSASKRKLKNTTNNKHLKKNINSSNDNKLTNRSVVLEQNILRQSLSKKNDPTINNKIRKEDSRNKKNKEEDEFDYSNSEYNNGNTLKNKRSIASSKYNLREDDLPLYKGEIDYNNVSIKNIPETIDDIFARYKKKGFTCVKKGDTEFKFVRGPNTHHVEIMRLGNGLLYFNITK